MSQADTPDSTETSENPNTIHQTLTNSENLTILTPKKLSLHQNNKASSKSSPAITIPKTTPIDKTQHIQQPLPNQNSTPPIQIPLPKPAPETSTPNLAERLRHFADKSLRRLAPVTFSEKGTPRVLITDDVFEEGAELHKDFIVCYFNGRAPPYSQIQSVLNHMWGKGKKLEIHNNPLTRSLIVMIPSEYLRTKILEKGAWYVGDSMFHTAKWTAGHSKESSSSATIQLWAHLTGVPLDLRHQK
ncbi:unnamed protein product [Microthlaspi erraticum]|uniref:DUF4283 domain-containing protein n=1 Tax=Microthlaspi erraticum TaxID=1685480 RepID=A0A6D2KMG5_9BRAS|nr:unnamed protein product [Microthlaspi erraticum]